MDANAQSTSADPWRESPQWQQAYFRQQAQTIGFWWQSPRAVAHQLGRSDSSLRYCLRRHRQRCQDSRWPLAWSTSSIPRTELNSSIICMLRSIWSSDKPTIVVCGR